MVTPREKWKAAIKEEANSGGRGGDVITGNKMQEGRGNT
jgi:hypothetical protein